MAEVPTKSVAFPTSRQIMQHTPLWVWRSARVVSMLTAAAVVVGLFVRPVGTLFVFWHIIVPLVPAVLLVAPGLWRNICPLAAVHQTPRALSLTKGRTAPGWIQQYGYIIAIGTFIIVVVHRKVVFNTDGPALAGALLATFGLALLGGRTLKGKSGWCASLCPVLPIERVYGQTPYVLIRNNHCEPCIGCTKNCYDFTPTKAYVADMHVAHPSQMAYRRWFVGFLPGFVLAYYQVPAYPQSSLAQLYGRTALYAGVSLGIFLTLEVFGRSRPNLLPTLFGATAFVIYYWFNAEIIPEGFGSVAGADLDPLTWPIRAAAIGLAAVWVLRGRHTEQLYERVVEVQPRQRSHF